MAYVRLMCTLTGQTGEQRCPCQSPVEGGVSFPPQPPRYSASYSSKLSFMEISCACVTICSISRSILSCLFPKISATCKLGMAETGKARQKKPHADGRAMRTGRRMRQRGWKVKAVVGQPAWPQCGAYSWAHSISWHTLRPTHWLHPQDCGSRADPDPCDRRR